MNDGEKEIVEEQKVSKVYQDKNNQFHEVVSTLSEVGGQGIIYRTKNPEIVIKIEKPKNNIINDNSNLQANIISSSIIEFDDKVNRKFTKLRLLPISENINITLPLVVLKNQAGYIMRLLNDMVSFQKAFNLEDDSIKYTNDYIQSYILQGVSSDDNENNNPEAKLRKYIARYFGNYIGTGGAIRRLTAYLQVSCYLARLHASSLVYCDISDNNLFISSNPKVEDTNVWLIDADNLNFQNKTKKQRTYYTKAYSAPEIHKGKGATFYSDSYSFMISFFWQLSGTHPFKGKLLDDANIESDKSDDFDDFDDDKEMNAYIGNYPWVFDKDDTSNSLTKKIIDVSYIFSKSMFVLLERMFSTKGKNSIYSRPSMFEIAHQIASDLNEVVKCQNCEMDYNYYKFDKCPYCDEVQNNLIVVETYYLDIDNNIIQSIQRLVKHIGDINYIPARLLTEDVVIDMDTPAFSVVINQEEKSKFIITKMPSLIKSFNFDSIKILESQKDIYYSHETDNGELSLIVTTNNIKKLLKIKVNNLNLL
ncbi:MAG: hypothetical protein R3Y29_00830 [bacterium]